VEVAGLDNRTTALTFTRGSFRWDQPEVGHEPSGRVEPTDLHQIGGKRDHFGVGTVAVEDGGSD